MSNQKFRLSEKISKLIWPAPLPAGGEKSQFTPPKARGFLLAVLAVSGALILRLALDPLWGDRLPYGGFFLAVLIVARFAGTGPQLLTLLAGLLLGDWFFLHPRHSLFISQRVDQVNAVVFCALSGLVMYISTQARRIVRRELAAREELIKELQAALAEVKTLKGLLPICAQCKKIRDDKGYWNKIEKYISERSHARFSHGLCPECIKELFPEN